MKTDSNAARFHTLWIQEETGRATESVDDANSLDGITSLVRTAYEAEHPYVEGQPHRWVRDIYPTYIVVQVGDDLSQVSYTIDADHQVTFGEPVAVVADVRYREISEAEEPEGDIVTITEAGVYRTLESLDDGEGRLWRVTMIRPGRSKNGFDYSPQVLQEASHLYDGARSFNGHRSPEERRRSGLNDLTGFHSDIEVADDGSLTSLYTIAEGQGQIQAQFMTAWKSDRADMIGFSHDVKARVGPNKQVQKILEVASVDVVADPSAGGRIERLVAGGDGTNEGESTMDDEELQAWAEANPEAAEALRAEGAAAAAPPAPEPTPEPVTEPAAEPATVTEAVLTPVMRRLVFDAAISEAQLPEQVATELWSNLESTEGLTEARLTETVTQTASVYATIAAAAPAPLPGQGPASGITRIHEDYDKRVLSLEGLIAGEDAVDPSGERVPAFRSLREAYHSFTGRHEHNLPGTADIGHWMLAESVGAVPDMASQRLTESVLTSSWTSAFADTMHRRLIAEYNFAPLRTWEALVSENTSVTDFKAQRRTRVGGFDTLSVVAENNPYPPLTTPADEEASFQVQKYGGTEVVTFEAFANDDLSAIRRVPKNMARAALVTLYNAIWITLFEGNAVTSYDATALFAAGHNNTTVIGGGLSDTALATLRTAMLKQTKAGEVSGFIGNTPKMLIHPSELWQEAKALTESIVKIGAANAELNAFGGADQLERVEVPLFTSPSTYYLAADPKQVPILEMGWYNGRRDPEILVQDGPTAGAVFTNDRVTYKIRHIWDVAVLDHRGLQRATVI